MVKIDEIPVTIGFWSDDETASVAHCIANILALVRLGLIRIVAFREMCLDVTHRLSGLTIHNVKVEAVVGLEVEKCKVADLERHKNQVFLVVKLGVIRENEIINAVVQPLTRFHMLSISSVLSAQSCMRAQRSITALSG